MTTLEQVRQRAESDANRNGYHLHPDHNYLKILLDGLKQNEERYGYPSCPCRLASGTFDVDRDIICPCDYRDPDVQEFGYCYCTLFIRDDVFKSKAILEPIPERRPPEKQDRVFGLSPETPEKKTVKKPISIERKMWYCTQCGYVCFRESPPFVCPICRAKREMFSEVAVK